MYGRSCQAVSSRCSPCRCSLAPRRWGRQSHVCLVPVLPSSPCSVAVCLSCPAEARPPIPTVGRCRWFAGLGTCPVLPSSCLSPFLPVQNKAASRKSTCPVMKPAQQCLKSGKLGEGPWPGRRRIKFCLEQAGYRTRSCSCLSQPTEMLGG